MHSRQLILCILLKALMNMRYKKRMKKKNPAAVALGSKGGKARARALTAKQRKDIAKNAAKERWSK